MTQRIFNLRKDPFDSRDHMAIRSPFSVSTSVNLGDQLGSVRDQKNAGSCTGQAGAGFMDWAYSVFKPYFPRVVLEPVEFSALFLYAQERISNGDFPLDAGSDSRTLMQVLTKIGICLNTTDPYSDTAINVLPTEAQTDEAEYFRLGAYHRVLFDDGLATAKSVLNSGYCRVIGIPVYPAIQSDEVAETGMLPIPTQLQTPIGGHEMLVFGYDDTIKIGSDVGAEMVRNSWGADWGLKGDLYIPYDYYAAAGGNDTCDSWVGHMGKPWVPKPN